MAPAYLVTVNAAVCQEHYGAVASLALSALLSAITTRAMAKCKEDGLGMPGLLAFEQMCQTSSHKVRVWIVEGQNIPQELGLPCGLRS